MKTLYKLSFILLFLLSFTKVDGQSTAEYFAIPGLSINAYHYNFFDGEYSLAHSFDGFEEIDGVSYHRYVNNITGNSILFLIEGDKVSYYNKFNQYLFQQFDFGLEVGDVITEGNYTGFEVSEVSTITLLNGEVRKQIKVKSGNYERTWVVGIGDIESGILPGFNDFEGYDIFVCAKIGDVLLVENEAEAENCDYYSCLRPLPSFEMELEDSKVTLSNTSKFATSYLWDFGDGNTSTEENPIHIYETAGCYKIKLIAITECTNEEKSFTDVASVCTKDAWTFDYGSDSLFLLNVHRFNNEIEYVWSGTNLFKVTNGGQDWEKLSTKGEEGMERSILTLKMWDENRGIAGANNYNQTVDKRSILVTDDGGLTWTARVGNSYWISNMMIGDNGKAWVSAGAYRSYYYKTLDYGISWDTIDIVHVNQLWGFEYIEGDVVYARGFDGVQPQGDYVLGKSINGGLTWDWEVKPYGLNNVTWFDQNIGYGHNREDNKVYETQDAGVTWTVIDIDTEVAAIAFNSPTHGWYTDLDGLNYYTTDKFATSSIANCGLTTIQRIAPLSDSTAYGFINTSIYASGQGNEKYTFDSADLGECSQIIDNDNDGYAEDVDCNDENPDINPGVAEVPYNGIDEDCNPETKDDDLDGDGFDFEEDCNDEDASINPDAEEIPNNDIDEDCTGADMTTSLDKISTSSKIKVFPNPTSGFVKISFGESFSGSFTLYDITGSKIMEGDIKGQKEIELSITSMSGVYFLKCQDQKGLVNVKKIVRM